MTRSFMVTFNDGEKGYIAVDSIFALIPMQHMLSKCNTIIYTVAGKEFSVQEKPEEIMQSFIQAQEELLKRQKEIDAKINKNSN